MAVGDAHVFPGFLTLVLTELFFPKPLTTFLTCFCRGERRKYASKKVCLSSGSSSQPPGHESDTLTTETPGWVLLPDDEITDEILYSSVFKAFGDRKPSVAPIMVFVLEMAENLFGKGENDGYHHVLLFPIMFSKALLHGIFKTQIVVTKCQLCGGLSY